MKKLVSAFLLGAGVASGVSAFAAVPAGYETDGLIACWDAIDNQGTGAHVGNATTWVDLVGDRTFNLAGATWSDLSLSFPGKDSSGGVISGDDAKFLNFSSTDKNRTVEIVFKYPDNTSAGILLMGTTSSKIAIGRGLTGGTLYTWVTSATNKRAYPALPGGAVASLSYGYTSGEASTGYFYHDGSVVSPAGVNDYFGSPSADIVYIGRRSTNANSLNGELYAIRVYNRLLTPEEVAANRAIDMARFDRVVAATVTAGSVTVGEPAVVINENLYIPRGTTVLPVDSADDAEILLDPSVTSLSVASGSLAVDLVQTGRRLKLAALDLGEDVVLRLPPQGVRVGTTLTAANGAVVKGPGRLYGPEESCPAELRDGAVYVSLTAPDKYGYVDGGELIAQWDAIDNQATGTHDASATTWVDLIMGQAFRPTGTEWGEKYLRFGGTSKSYATLTGDDALALLDYTDESTTRTVELVFKYDNTTSDGVLMEGPTHSGIAIGRYHGGLRTIYQIASGKTEATEPDDGFYTISACYDKGVVQIGPTRQDNEAVPLTKGVNYWGSANATTITLGKTTTGTSYCFAGRPYAIRVYDRQLTEAEATQNYNADQQRFNRAPAATVVSGSVTAGGVTYEAGETILTPDEELTLAVESAADAILVLDARITGLSLADGALKLDDSPAGAVENLGSLALGATAVLQLPKDGLRVAGELTAEAGATVRGPGLLVGTAATCPAGLTLTDGAVYLSSQGGWTGWPSSGIAYIPAGVTAPILAGDVEKVANLEKIVFLADTAKVTYELGDAFELTTPVEGPGTFAFASAGDVTISADNANLTGAFFFTNTTVLVTHENGLGSTQAKTCHFWCGDTTTATPYGHTLDFDNGETVFTNRVAIHLHPLATKSITFGAISSDKTLVQDADFYFSRYNKNQDYMYPAFRGTVKFLRHFEYVVGTWTQYPYSSVTGGDGVWIMGDFRLKSTGLWLPQDGPYHLGWSSIDSTVSLSPYSTARIVCEAENILGGMSFQPYQVNSLFDLNGHDQDSDHLGNYNNGSVTTGDPLLRITSATPAAFRITGTDSKNINVRFSGAAGFTMAGTGTYGLYDADSETTGELKVEKGTLKLCDNYAWRGTNVTVTGGALVLESARAVTVNKTHLVVSGGTLTVKAGATAFVGFATFGATTLEDGTYTMAQLKAMPGVASFIGADSDDDAFITVLKPDDREWHGWPDEPADVEIPGNMTIYVGADETNKVALAKSIDLGAGARVVFTNMPDAVIALAMPISGRGVLAFEDCGMVVITADNSGLEAPGAFSFTRTDVQVANRYGLGAAGTGPCYVYTSKELGARACSMIFTGEAKTNDVAIVVDHAWAFGYDSADVDFVQNANFTQSGGGTLSHQRCRFKNSIVFTGTVAVNDTDEANKKIRLHFTETASLTRSSGSCPWIFGSSASELIFDAPNPSLSGIVFQFGWHVYLNVPYAFNFGSDGLSCYPGATTFHLDGNDQQVAYIAFANEDRWEKASDDPIVFTSDEPATLFMTNNRVNPNGGAPVDSRRTFKLTGAVSLDYGGSRLQRMGRGHNDTTGSLTVRGGQFEIGYDSYWGGTNVTVLGGTLIIAEKAATNAVTGAGMAFNRKTILQVSGTGAVDIAAGRTETVKCYGIDGVWQPAGTYTLGAGKLRVRRNSPDEGILILVR